MPIQVSHFNYVKMKSLFYLLCRSAWGDGMAESPHELASGHPFSQTVQDGYKPTWCQKTNVLGYISICCILKQWSIGESDLVDLLSRTH